METSKGATQGERLVYCRKKNRSKWRHSVAENRRRSKPRGQSVQVPTVREKVVCTVFPNGFFVIDEFDLKTVCRPIKKLTRQKLRRVPC